MPKTAIPPTTSERRATALGRLDFWCRLLENTENSRYYVNLDLVRTRLSAGGSRIRRGAVRDVVGIEEGVVSGC
jgi:hypothetical protein